MIQLVTRDAKLRDENQVGIIKELKKLLSEAERGDFAAVVMVAVRHDGSFKSCIPAGQDAMRTIGYLETLKYDLIERTQLVEDDSGTA